MFADLGKVSPRASSRKPDSSIVATVQLPVVVAIRASVETLPHLWLLTTYSATSAPFISSCFCPLRPCDLIDWVASPTEASPHKTNFFVLKPTFLGSFQHPLANCVFHLRPLVFCFAIFVFLGHPCKVPKASPPSPEVASLSFARSSEKRWAMP